MKVSVWSILAGNNISPKNKLATNLCACEVPKSFNEEPEGLWHAATGFKNSSVLCKRTTT